MRRATPAVLTGVSERPILASAVGTRSGSPGTENCSPISKSERHDDPGNEYDTQYKK